MNRYAPYQISIFSSKLLTAKDVIDGSALVTVLLLIAVAGILTAAWVTLISARSGMVEQMATAVQRRIALENSKALAQEFMLERVLPSASGSAFDYNLSDPGWGGISVPAWDSAPLLSTQKAAGVNHFNPGNGDGYTLDLLASVRDGNASFQRKYQIKSRSPLLAGSLLLSQTPTLSPAALIDIGNLTVMGGAFIWNPNLSMTFTTSSYSMPEGGSAVTFANSSGGSTLPMNNLALPRQIANPRSGGALFYSGQFDAINNLHPAANSSTAKVTAAGIVVDGSTVSSSNGVSCDGNGNVTITLNAPDLGNVYIPGEISSLTLEGQNVANDAVADDLPAILIVVDQSLSSTRDLAYINLTQYNSRRVDLAVKKASAIGKLPVRFITPSTTWRLLLELENTPILLITINTITVQGGIRSDRAITLIGGALLTLENDPKYLERLSTRTAWIESFAP